MITNRLPMGFVIFLILWSPFSFALRCLPTPSFGERIGKAESVFIVKVIDVAKDGLTARFLIEKIYKGNKPETEEMTINPMPFWFDKTFFRKDQKYLSFYQHNEPLSWGACSKNIILMNETNTPILEEIVNLQLKSMSLEDKLLMQEIENKHK